MSDECKCASGTKTEIKQFKYLLGIGLFTGIVVAASLWIAPYLWVDDTSAIARFLVLKVPPMFIDAFVLIGALVLFDFIGDEDSLSCIYKDPMATSILYSALVISLGISIAFG